MLFFTDFQIRPRNIKWQDWKNTAYVNSPVTVNNLRWTEWDWRERRGKRWTETIFIGSVFSIHLRVPNLRSKHILFTISIVIEKPFILSTSIYSVNKRQSQFEKDYTQGKALSNEFRESVDTEHLLKLQFQSNVFSVVRINLLPPFSNSLIEQVKLT